MSDQEGDQFGDDVVRRPRISVKCHGKRLFEIIPKLKDCQVSAVRRIGFGGMLDLKFKHFPLDHVHLFLDCFTDGSYVFRAPKRKHFMVSKHDVHDCFLLPYGPNALDLVPTAQQKGSNSLVNVQLKDRWRKIFNVQDVNGSIPIGKLKDAILADTEGGDFFCRVFVLFCMSSFLAPTINNSVDFKLLRAVEDVNAIPHLDWCSYVLKAIVTAGKDVIKKQSHLVGCIPFLMITYFQRFDFRGEICAHDLPLIKHWSEARLKSRINGEVSDGGLGRQTWSSVKYPRCIHAPNSTEVIVRMNANELIPSSSNSNSVKRFIQIELPQGVEDDQELKARALDDVHELYLKIQRNAVAFCSWYASAISGIKKISGGCIDETGLVPSQSTQDFWRSDPVNRYCDDVEDLAERMKLSVSKAPELTQFGTSTIDLGDAENITASMNLSQVLDELKNSNQDADVDDLPVKAPSEEAVSNKKEAKIVDVLGKSPFIDGPSDDGVVRLGDDEVPSPTVPVSSAEVIDTGIFYKSAEINEVIQGIKEVSHVPENLGASPTVMPSGSDRNCSVQQLGSAAFYNTAEINEVMLPGNAFIPDSKMEERQILEEAGSVQQLGSSAFYNTAEINEVMNPGNASIPVTVTEERQLLEEAGYTPSEVNEAVKYREGHIDLDVADVAEGKVARAGSEGKSSTLFKTPANTDDPKRKIDDEYECEVTYKRRRSSTPVPIVTSSSAEPLSALSSRRRGKGDGLGCSYGCGDVSGLATVVVSIFLRNNQTLFKDVKDLRKHVADYCFLDDNGMPNEEVVARYGPNASLTRHDIQTMHPDYPMSSSVIECWSMLLNMIEWEAFQVARMAFFGLRQTDVLRELMNTPTQCTPSDTNYDMLYKHWDVFVNDCGKTINLGADLIFIPIKVDDHFACVCINFNSRTVDLLDNQSHPDPKKSNICKAASILVSAMSDYLEYKGVPRGSDVASFNHRQIKFDWTRPTPHDKESGIFTMIHMLMYEGEPFQHNDLNSKTDRRYLVIEIAASLVLADMNSKRLEVLHKIEGWVAGKPDLWKKIRAARRLAKLVTKAAN